MRDRPLPGRAVTMYSLFIECKEAEVDLLSAELWEEGATGIQEENLPGSECRLRAWFADPAGLVRRFAAYNPRIEADPDIDWELVSRQAWQPFVLGGRLYMAPEWDESPTPAGRVRVTLHPGMALGTGAHPATQLCLIALDRHLKRGETVLDVGTGSGILASAALKLGARQAFGCDIDSESLMSARSNLTRDALRIHLFAGSARTVRNAGVDLVAANINATTHEGLAPEYVRAARRLVILSGFPDRHLPRVEAALKRQGARVIDTLTQMEWVCLVISPGAR